MHNLAKRISTIQEIKHKAEKIMRSSFWALCLPAIIMLSCKAGGGDSSVVEIDSFSDKSNASFFEEVYSDIRLLPLDLGGRLLGSSHQLGLEKAGDGFVITDMQTEAILLIGPDGTLKTYVSKVGRGPGEYNYLQTCKYRDHKMIALADDTHIIEYTEDGELSKEYTIDYALADIMLSGNGGATLLMSRYDGEEDICDRIIFTDDSYSQTSSFFPLEYQLFNFGSHFTKLSEEEYFYVPLSMPQVFKCRGNEVVTTYNFNFRGKGFPEAFLKSDDWEVIYDVMMSTPEIYYVGEAFETSDFLLFGLGNIIDGEDRDSGLWLIDRKDMSSKIEYFDRTGPEFGFFGPPQMLTSDNEVVYICDVSLYDEVKDSVPGLSKYASLFKDCPSDYAILYCKIGK